MNNQRFIKRLASFMLILAMVFTIVPMGNVVGFAEEVKAVEGVKDTVVLKVIGYEDENILSLEKAEIEKDEIALNFVKRSLDENKIKYNADKGYISEIAGLGAFDKGEFSGWMTRINGKYPEVGLGDIKLKKDDLVEIVYIQNYNSIFYQGKGKLVVKALKDEKVLETEFVETKKDETALDFVKRILDENKIEYKADKGYFESINKLAAFDKGERSGWMTKVNDLMPEVGLGDIKVSDGIVVEMFYVEDYETIFPPEEGGDIDELFTDMGKHEWAKEAVESLAVEGVIEGTGNNKFSPAAEVTRAEFATMASRLLKLEKVGENKFKDIKKTDWYYEDILKLSNEGYINGRDDGNFDPKGKITRQEIATIVGNILKDKDVTLEDKEAIKKFTDYKTIANWAVEGAGLVVQEEIVNGIDGKFMPKKNATRAESATMLFRLSEKIK